MNDFMSFHAQQPSRLTEASKGKLHEENDDDVKRKTRRGEKSEVKAQAEFGL